MNNKIIGLVGFIGSGKGTVGKYLESQYNFKSVSFANSLKDAVSAIFGWPRYLLEGDTDESRLWREQPDMFWSRKLNHPVTPRWVLQTIGTDILRNKFLDNIWIWSLEQQLEKTQGSVVITDVRFPNEIQMIESLGGKLWWIQRNPLPEWVDIAVGDKNKMKLEFSHIHYSEYAWLGITNFTILNNDLDLQSLYKQVDICLNT